jgi:nanoRNase/pAp phosphatase (c-di-AMP/oligoRNAs hydrolase)
VKERLEKLLGAVSGVKQLLILPHNDPDPDSIASTVALRHLLGERAGVEGRIVYRGIIGRAENKALVRYLSRPLQRLSDADSVSSLPVALIDTQPGAGNNALPAGRMPLIVLDHHPPRPATAASVFADVRSELGATSTILTQYLQAAGVEPGPRLATALFYGIKTDTRGLSRGTSRDDMTAYLDLQPSIDVQALIEIEQAQVPAAYFRSFDTALRAARLYDGAVIVSMGPMDYPDLAAEMADLLMRLNHARWVICMGVYKRVLFLSVRARNERMGAERLVVAVVGGAGTAGGHGAMAGGQIPLGDSSPVHLAAQVRERILDALGIASDLPGEPII